LGMALQGDWDSFLSCPSPPNNFPIMSGVSSIMKKITK